MIKPTQIISIQNRVKKPAGSGQQDSQIGEKLQNTAKKQKRLERIYKGGEPRYRHG